MNPFHPEIQELVSAVKAKYGKSLDAPSDFEEFSLYLYKHTEEVISASTLKRLCGYVKYPHNTRKYTLDVLSRFVGYNSFEEYCAWLKTSPAYNSSFFSTKQIASSDLKIGQYLEIGWSPNRYLLIRYNGNNTYSIEKAKSSKLQAGDCFETDCFYIGYPLYLPYVIHDNQRTKPFIAGRNGGLTILNAVKNEQLG